MRGTGSGEKYDRYSVGMGVYNVTINNEGHEVFYGLDAPKAGKYRIESWADGIDTVLHDYYANDYFVPDASYEGDDDSGEDLNFSYEVTFKKSMFIETTDENGNTVTALGARWTFGFSVKNVESYPVTFPVAFFYVAESYEAPRPSVSKVKVSETLTQFPDGTVTLTSVKMDGSVTVVYNDEDRFYHVGSKDGAILTAKLTKPCEYLDTAISKIQDAGNSALLLEYSYDYTDFIARYAEVCNTDGVYGVTEELKLFFDRFQKTHSYFTSGGWVADQLDYKANKDCYWMFASYYYA